MKQLLLITLTLTLMLTYAGCRLEQLHGEIPEPEPGSEVKCPISSINGITDYQPEGYQALDIAKTDDTYMVCGNVTGTGNTFLMEIDAEGKKNFFTAHDNQAIATGTYTANSVLQMEDGSGQYVICGRVSTGFTKQAFFAVCSPTGELRDIAVGDEQDSRCEQISYVNGQYVFVGYVGDAINGEDIYVGTLEITPDYIASTEYTKYAEGNQRAYAVQTADDGGFLFVGHDITNISVPYMFHLDENLETFSECSSGNSLGIKEIYPKCITTMPSGGYLISGYLQKSTDAIFNAFTLKVNTNCSYSDLRIIDSDENVRIYGVNQTDDGDYLLCGNRKTGTSGNDPTYAYILKLDEAGRFIKEYAHGENTPISETISNIVVTDECNYLSAGYIEESDEKFKILVVEVGE